MKFLLRAIYFDFRFQQSKDFCVFISPKFSHKFTEDDNFDIVSPFVLFPCARRLITHYFWIYSVVHFNMYSCTEQGARSYVLPMFRVIETYTAARIWKCTVNGRCVDKKNQLDVTFCILYFSSNSCSTCFGQPWLPETC